MAVEKILLNGKIYTSNEKAPWAEALAISGKHLAYVGDNETARAMAEEETEIIDLGGKAVIPGIIDGHTHPVTVAKTHYRVRMPLTHDKDELYANIKKYAELNPKEEKPFFFCENYFAECFGPEGPRKEDLDKLVPDRPARIQDFTDHACWYNSIAIEMLKDENGIPQADSPLGFSEFKRMKTGNTQDGARSPDRKETMAFTKRPAGIRRNVPMKR